MSTETLARAVRDGIARTIAAVGLAGVALIHLLDLPGKFHETPYLAWLYIALIVACLAGAAALVRSGDSRAWSVAALLPLGPLAGYVLTRTVGLPQATGDIGNWTEPLGLASLFVEGTLAALSFGMLASMSDARRFSLAEACGTRQARRVRRTAGATARGWSSSCTSVSPALAPRCSSWHPRHPLRAAGRRPDTKTVGLDCAARSKTACVAAWNSCACRGSTRKASSVTRIRPKPSKMHWPSSTPR